MKTVKLQIDEVGARSQTLCKPYAWFIWQIP